MANIGIIKNAIKFLEIPILKPISIAEKLNSQIININVANFIIKLVLLIDLTLNINLLYTK